MRVRLRACVRARAGGAAYERCRKPLAWMARGIVLVAVTAGAVAGGRLLEQHVRSAKAFATHEIEVSGVSRLSRADVLAAAGLALGQNVFEVSPEQARDKLVAPPWIADATVTPPFARQLPIRCASSSPRRCCNSRRCTWSAKRAPCSSSSRPTTRPTCRSSPASIPKQFRADLAFRTSVLVNAIALLHDYRDVGLWRREPIAEIHAEGEDAFSLYVGKDAMLVRLGERPFRTKLRRLRGILDELRADSGRPAYVYLDNVRRPDRVAVRLR